MIFRTSCIIPPLPLLLSTASLHHLLRSLCLSARMHAHVAGWVTAAQSALVLPLYIRHFGNTDCPRAHSVRQGSRAQSSCAMPAPWQSLGEGKEEMSALETCLSLVCCQLQCGGSCAASQGMSRHDRIHMNSSLLSYNYTSGICQEICNALLKHQERNLLTKALTGCLPASFSAQHKH